MPTEALSPDEELAQLRARRNRTRVVWLSVAVLVASASVAAWWLQRPVPETPDRTLFSRELPRWSIEKINGQSGDWERKHMLDAAAPWPGVREGLDKLATAYGTGRPAFKTAIAELNTAVRTAQVPYWVDAPFTSGKQFVTTYDLLGRANWSLANGEKTVEVLRVRRLDHVNLEMEFLGHAGGDHPAVLADRIEADLIDLVRSAYSTDDRVGEVEQAARGAWRAAMQPLAGAEALAEAAKLLDERAARVKRLSEGFARRVDFDVPDRIVLGDDWLDTLEPYVDPKRPGGPLLLRQSLVAVREADRALRIGPVHHALEIVRDQMMRDTEAHEARHIFEPFPAGSQVPRALVEVIGDEDDPSFNESAARELLAYIGQLNAAEQPCTVLAGLAFRAAGDHARSTPHHYASWLLLQSVGSAPEEPLTEERLANDVVDLCHAPAEALRAKAAEAHEKLFGTPFVAATRSAAL